MIAGWLAQLEKVLAIGMGWIEQYPDLALLIFAVLVVVFGVRVVLSTPRRWK